MMPSDDTTAAAVLQGQAGNGSFLVLGTSCKEMRQVELPERFHSEGIQVKALIS